MNLRYDWLPVNIYGEDDYYPRVLDLRRRRYYGKDHQDKAGILRYTKVTEALIDLTDIPEPSNERELAWLLSFYWKVDQAYNSLQDLVEHKTEGREPLPHLLRAIEQTCQSAIGQDLQLSDYHRRILDQLGISI